MSIKSLLGTAALAFASVSSAQTLNVYTYDSFASEWGPGPKVKQAFEAQCDCELNFVTLDSSVGILSRVQLEGSESQADVLLGLDLNVMQAAKQTGLLAKHGVDTSNVTTPGGWSDEYFVPFDQGYFSFIYNSEAITTPPKSLKDVVENQDLRVIYQDPRTSTPGLGLLLWMKAVYGEQADDAWQTLAQHTVTVTKGWSDSYSLFLKGEADVVLSYTTSEAYHVVAEGEHKYKAVSASEGYYPQIEVAAMLKESANSELAEQFMAFILQPEFQNTIATNNWMYPVIEDVEPLPDAFTALPSDDQVLTLPAEQVAKQRQRWINEWLDATTR
ncbi:thiamine ABC transporter substrate binding subunit [Marinomonas ostreistagni]|uniref:thiamine ABC transporter substrate binding subunit n=1 Tax=Marinomonas ostreistagni TaxID=359209 RepID=UPI001950D331|nr:thiamine ABC transporter substrate binding subunit [Marinomonas ostreistagni]MBM6551221.1 thiamine ABC transporter substrate binding subunit [Marinomonas ostreistagni]